MPPPSPQDATIAELDAGVAPVPRRRRTADGLVDVLTDAGVDTVFGLPGGPISPRSARSSSSQVRQVA